MSHIKNVPSINVVTSETFTEPIQSPLQADSLTPSPISPSPATQGHSRSPSDPNYLSAPYPILVRPASPTSSTEDAPPSPTLSASSVHFKTTTDLRGRSPGDGLSSLQAVQQHARKNSAASFQTITEPDHSSHNMPPSSATSITAAISPTSPTKKGSIDKGDAHDARDAPATVAHINPADDHTDPAPFTFKPYDLAALVDPKTLKDLDKMGGVEGLCAGLGTDRTKGLSAHSLGQGAGAGGEKSGGAGPFAAPLSDRQRVYGTNSLPTRPSKSLLQLMWLALKDKVLVLLSIAAVISLALGIYQDVGVKHPLVACSDDPTRLCESPRVDFVEGVAIIIAILIVVLVGSLNDWQKERQFRALNEKKEDRNVKVIRNGKEQQVNIRDVLVGDLALLEPGEIIPCDGILVAGHNVRCDESGATGESDAIRKVTPEEALADWRVNMETKKDPFVISGSKVLEGVGQYIVIAVGTKSFNGRIMMALTGDAENTPLQLKLNHLAELIAKIGGTCGLALFTALMIKFFIQFKTDPTRSGTQKAMTFVQILIISVTLVVVAVPEGLPLAVTLALAFATKRMTYENLLVRVLGSCETMANATVVCTDKTGTLTQNMMSVVAGSVGVHAKFVKNLQENLSRSNADKADGQKKRKHADDFSIEQTDLNDVLSPALQQLFNEGIAVNSTAFEDTNSETGKVEFVGSKTETALLNFAKDLGWTPYQETRNTVQVVQMLPFASERKYMGVLIRNGDKYRVYFKGASEILTNLCTRHVVVNRPEQDNSGSEDDAVEIQEIDGLSNENIANTIIFYANQMLRTIALCYKDVDTWPPRGASGTEEIPLSELANGLTLVGIVGIEDPLRPGVRDAVADCSRAGVTIKMCTGDNVLTARSIASQCGIYTAGGIIMEGPEFRKLTEEERNEVVPRLQVLARSSPEDKKILVETLKRQGQVVGVTGDGTNDGPALKTANVGFSMGIAGTEVAKEASDIILMDDNFASIVSAIIWGRCVNDSVRKFLQFQISVNITAVLITFITAVASSSESSVLTAVQLLWINIIMDTFAALALATDRATRALLDRKPDPKTAPLFTLDMGKMIIGQAIYQTTVILVFHFAGPSIYNLASDDTKGHNQLNTLVFNIFVFCQIFNCINCRRIDNKYNVFEGILKDWYFLGITLLEIAIQVIIMFVGGAAFSVARISPRDWGISIAFGFLSIPIGVLIRTIPNGPIRNLLIHVHIMQDPNALPVVDPATEKYNQAIDQVRDNLSTFANIRGGRSSSVVRKGRSARLHDAGVQIPSMLAMAPALIAASVGAGWQPKQSAALHDPGNSDPSKSSADLWAGKLQLHPDTHHDDPAYTKWGRQLERRPEGPSK